MRLVNDIELREREAAVERVFSKLPLCFRTTDIRAEISKRVAFSLGDFDDAARRSVAGVLMSVDRSLRKNS
jgi:hypothetical protein